MARKFSGCFRRLGAERDPRDAVPSGVAVRQPAPMDGKGDGGVREPAGAAPSPRMSPDVPRIQPPRVQDEWSLKGSKIGAGIGCGFRPCIGLPMMPIGEPVGRCPIG